MISNTSTESGKNIPFESSSTTNCAFESNDYVVPTDLQYEFEDTPVKNPIKAMRIKHISHLDLDGYGSTILSEILQSYVQVHY